MKEAFFHQARIDGFVVERDSRSINKGYYSIENSLSVEFKKKRFKERERDETDMSKNNKWDVSTIFMNILQYRAQFDEIYQQELSLDDKTLYAEFDETDSREKEQIQDFVYRINEINSREKEQIQGFANRR